MKILNNKQLSASGFTIIEVLAAVMILSIGLVGGLTAITSNLKNISSSANKAFAAGLVEDGMERIRNKRDTNWLKGKTLDTNWDTDIDGVTAGQKFIKIFCGNGDVADISDPDPADIDDCIDDGNCKIFVYNKASIECYSDDFGATYPSVDSYTGVQHPGFYRMINISQDTAHSNKVTVTVRWSEGGQNKYLIAEEILYNWKN